MGNPVGRPSSTGFKHLEHFKDRRNIDRYYLRVGHGPRFPIDGEYNSEEFKRNYNVAFMKMSQEKALIESDGCPRYPDGSIGSLIAEYMENPRYKNLTEGARHRKPYLNMILRDYGFMPVRETRTKDIQKILAKYEETKGTHFNLRKTLYVLFDYAKNVAPPLIVKNPVDAVPNLKQGEIRDWEENEIEQFEKFWVPGDYQRTMFDLYLYTGQRSSDVRKMMWNHISGGRISVIQTKKTGKEKKRQRLDIKVHANLARTLAEHDIDGEFIFVSSAGGIVSETTWNRTMSEAIRSAGLPDDCKPHGLRKAMARRLAEVGCSAHQIQSITGHLTLDECQRYCKAARQVILADDAIRLLEKKIRHDRVPRSKGKLFSMGR